MCVVQDRSNHTVAAGACCGVNAALPPALVHHGVVHFGVRAESRTSVLRDSALASL